MSFFGTALTVSVTLLHIYVFARAYPVFARYYRVDRKLFVATAGAVWAPFFLGRVLRGREYGLPAEVLEVAGMHWMASVFLLAVGLLAADLITGFGYLLPQAKLRIRALGLAGGLLFVGIAHAQGLRSPTIEVDEVFINELPANLDGTTIAVLSDLHVGETAVGSRWLNARIDQTLALRPDLIVLVGDLFEREADPSELAPIARRFSAPLGVWAVRGNHDSVRPGRRDVTGEILDAAGIRLLSNEWARVTDGLVLAGIDDLTSSRRRPGEGEANIERTFAGLPTDATIFLSHTSWMTDRAAAAGVDLMLSGHTHNGQIWPFNYLARTRYPHIVGRYEIDGMTLNVSRGTGTWGPRMRLWARGEITLISLRSGPTAAAQ